MAWIDTLLRRQVELGASDLHMTSGSVPRFRLHGDILPVEGCPEIAPEQLQRILSEIAPEANAEEYERTHDADFAYELEGSGRFRVNLFVDMRGPAAAFRAIPTDILTVEDLKLPQVVTDLCELSKGLVVVTGPTGSGKSTTLAAMVDHINRTRAEHIITIEDPIEFVHPPKKCLVNQREVGRHTDSFKRALRAALREDPDIVLVGEMRDLETVEIAIETAETGHLVFGTLHTTTAASTVDRLIDQFPAGQQAQIRTMLSTSLKGVIAQTLCRKKPEGRVAALEILVVNSAISAQIREGKTFQITSSMQMGGKLGMRLLNDSLVELVSEGLVDPAEALLKSVSKEDMRGKLSRVGIHLDPDAPRASVEAPAVAAEAPTLLSMATESADALLAAPLPAREPAPEPESAQPIAQPSPLPEPAAGDPTGPDYVDPFEAFKKHRS